MKERPILFSAPMVRALLDGIKTQTRRVAKHPLLQTLSYVVNIDGDWFGDEEGDFQIKCPYGQPGDQLWVRETWRKVEPGECGCSEHCNHSAGYDYRATGSGDDETTWKPSIHMPRAASRIQLEITGVRVERLQDISEEDAKAEGCPCYVCGNLMDGKNEDDCHCFHRKAGVTDYLKLWESINGPGSWAANPWVWVIEFRREQP